MSGYVRQDTTNNINNGNIIDALYLDQEYDAIAAAFNSSSGHTHDGSAAEGAPITVIGPAQDFLTTSTYIRPKTNATYDLGTNGYKFKNGYFSDDLTVNGTITGAYAATGLTGTIASARLSGSYTGITGVGALAAGSITNTFGAIDIGSSSLSCGFLTSTFVSSTGAVVADNTFRSSTANVILSNDGSGDIFLRPQGQAVTTGQVRIFNDGSVTVNGTLTATLAGNGSNVTNLNASSLSSGTVPSARLNGAYNNITGVGNLTVLTVDNINFDGSNIKQTTDAAVLRIYGGNVSGANIELGGPSHANIPWQINYDANTHLFRNGDGSATRATLGGNFDLGNNVAISFQGTGAANTRTNLGLGTAATRNIDTGDGDLRSNLANDNRFHISGVNTLAVGDLPTTTAARDWVLERNAGGQNGAVGMVALLRYDGSTTVVSNGTVTGQLFYASVNGAGTSSASGQWRLLGRIGNSSDSAVARTSLWMRVS